MPFTLPVIASAQLLVLSCTRQTTAGLSPEARALEELCLGFEERDADSIFLNGRKAQAESALIVASEEAEEDGNAPVSEETLTLAQKLIESLPEELPLPEVSAETDGAMNLEWHVGYRREFSVSVRCGAKLVFAGLDGADRHHGVAHFDGMIAPRTVVDAIRGLTVG